MRSEVSPVCVQCSVYVQILPSPPQQHGQERQDPHRLLVSPYILLPIPCHKLLTYETKNISMRV